MKKNTIGFIGIGLMGAPMAKNLLKSKYQVKVFNRTKNKAASLKKFGAKVCNSLKEVVSNQDLIFTMLSDDKAIKKIYYNSEFLKNLKKGSTVIDMSSANPNTALNLSKLLKKHKVNFLDAPVSGGTTGAENAELAIMVGGEKKIFNKYEVGYSDHLDNELGILGSIVLGAKIVEKHIATKFNVPNIRLFQLI